jgi:hypothetical protein
MIDVHHALVFDQAAAVVQRVPDRTGVRDPGGSETRTKPEPAGGRGRARSARSEPGWPLRVRVRVRRRALDRQIAAGASLDSPARALRAQQLAGSAERHLVATWFELILAAADERQADPASQLVVNYTEVIGSRVQLLTLIGLLRGTSPVSARGVARARWLAESPNSPVIRAQADRAVKTALREIIAELVTGR